MKKRIVFFVILLSVMLFSCVAIIGCTGDKPEKLSSPTNIRYDSAIITWDAVKDAEFYNVKINNGEIKKVETNKYSFKQVKDIEFTFEVNACRGEEASDFVSMAFSPIGTVERFDLDKDILSWSENTKATGYAIRLNNTNLSETNIGTQFEDFVAGSNSIEVMPIVVGDYSFYGRWSQSYTLTKLATPTNLKYDSMNITWSAVSGCDNYEIDINGAKHASAIARYGFTDGNGQLDLTVRALGNNTSKIVSSSPCEVETYHMFPAITDLAVEDGELIWSSVEGADYYNVFINGALVGERVNDCRYSKITANTSYTFSVMAAGDVNKRFYSKKSPAIGVKVLSAPTLSVSKGDTVGSVIVKIAAAVPGASDYKISWTHSNGSTSGSETVSNSNLGFNHGFETDGTYTLTAQSLAPKGSESYNSKKCSPIMVERQVAPTDAEITSDLVAEDPKINVKLSAGSTKFIVKIDGGNEVKFDTKNFTLNLPNTTSADEKTYNVDFYARESYDDPTKIKLQSLNSYSVSIVRMAQVSAPTISNGNLIWDSIENSQHGYAVYGKKANLYDSVTLAKMDLTGITPSVYNFKVQAKGNGATVLAGSCSTVTQVTKLVAPANIKRAGTREAVNWDSVANSQGYTINLSGESDVSVSETSYTIPTNRLNIQGARLQIKAVGKDSENILSSEFSPIVTLYKLATPTGIKVNDSEFSWNSVANTANGYNIYSGDEKTHLFKEGITTGTSFPSSDFVVATQYKISVKALGSENVLNSSIYFDSEISEIKVFTKLAAMTVKVQNNAYAWNSVQGANKYSVVAKNGTFSKVDIGAAITTFAPNWLSKDNLETGNQDVYFRALGDGGETCISSDTVTLTQKLEMLTAPTLSLAYDGESCVVTVIYSGKGSPKFIVNDGADHEIEGKTYTIAQPVAGNDYTIWAKTKGGFFEADTSEGSLGTYFINSRSTAASPFKILSAVTFGSIISSGFNAAKIVSWGSVQGVTSYEVTINGVTSTTQSAFIAIGSITGSITVAIKAKGNGSNTFDSEVTTKTLTIS